MKIKKILKNLREVEVFVVATSNQEAIAKIKEAIELMEHGTPKPKPATEAPKTDGK